MRLVEEDQATTIVTLNVCSMICKSHTGRMAKGKLGSTGAVWIRTQAWVMTSVDAR